MPIVVEDFEVVVETPPQTVRGAEAESSALDQVDALAPPDVERITERQMERFARIRAH